MKITPEIALEMNKLYKKLGSYAAVSREIGCTAATVKKYIIPNFRLEVKHREFDKSLLVPFNVERFKDIDNIALVCLWDEAEWKEIEELREEIMI